MSAILELQGVKKAFGAVVVADDQSWSLAPGEALGVLGPNGAGKTSMFNLVTGTLSTDAGRIRLDGQDITGWSAARRCRADSVGQAALRVDRCHAYLAGGRVDPSRSAAAAAPV